MDILCLQEGVRILVKSTLRIFSFKQKNSKKSKRKISSELLKEDLRMFIIVFAIL